MVLGCLTLRVLSRLADMDNQRDHGEGQLHLQPTQIQPILLRLLALLQLELPPAWQVPVFGLVVQIRIGAQHPTGAEAFQRIPQQWSYPAEATNL